MLLFFCRGEGEKLCDRPLVLLHTLNAYFFLASGVCCINPEKIFFLSVQTTKPQKMKKLFICLKFTACSVNQNQNMTDVFFFWR